MISFSKLHEWLDEEKQLGASEPEHVVLATASKEGIPSFRKGLQGEPQVVFNPNLSQKISV